MSKSTMKPTVREEAMANELEDLVLSMLDMYNTVSIDKIEAVFERNCSRCRLSKDCGQCAAQVKFISILDTF